MCRCQSKLPLLPLLLVTAVLLLLLPPLPDLPSFLPAAAVAGAVRGSTEVEVVASACRPSAGVASVAPAFFRLVASSPWFVFHVIGRTGVAKNSSELCCGKRESVGIERRLFAGARRRALEGSSRRIRTGKRARLMWDERLARTLCCC